MLKTCFSPSLPAGLPLLGWPGAAGRVFGKGRSVQLLFVARSFLHQPVYWARVVPLWGGDTSWVSFQRDNEGDLRVRPIGIDRPDVDPKQCYGPAARESVREFLEGRLVAPGQT